MVIRGPLTKCGATGVHCVLQPGRLEELVDFRQLLSNGCVSRTNLLEVVRVELMAVLEMMVGRRDDAHWDQRKVGAARQGNGKQAVVHFDGNSDRSVQRMIPQNRGIDHV